MLEPEMSNFCLRYVLVASLLTAALELTVCVPFALAKDNPPMGMVGVSAGDVVVLVDPASGAQKSISTGPVGWLFPAPGDPLPRRVFVREPLPRIR